MEVWIRIGSDVMFKRPFYGASGLSFHGWITSFLDQTISDNYSAPSYDHLIISQGPGRIFRLLAPIPGQLDLGL